MSGGSAPSRAHQGQRVGVSTALWPSSRAARASAPPPRRSASARRARGRDRVAVEARQLLRGPPPGERGRRRAEHGQVLVARRDREQGGAARGAGSASQGTSRAASAGTAPPSAASGCEEARHADLARPRTGPARSPRRSTDIRPPRPAPSASASRPRRRPPGPRLVAQPRLRRQLLRLLARRRAHGHVRPGQHEAAVPVMLGPQRVQQADREHAVLVYEVGAEAEQEGPAGELVGPARRCGCGRREVSR